MSVATRAAVEAVLVLRTGPYLEAASLAVTTAGANADLNDSLRRTLTLMGYAPVALTVTDADLAELDTPELLEEFLDRAELRVLETCQGRMADPSLMVEGLIQVQQAELGKNLATAIRQRADAILANWGHAGTGSTLGTQVVRFGFQQRYPACYLD